MKRFCFFSLMIVLSATAAWGQITVQSSMTAEALVKEVLAGRGIKVRGVRFSGNSLAIAKFENPSANPHFEEGIILSTGKAIDMIGPNNAPKTSTVNARGGDKLLYNIAHGRTFDAAILEFDVMTDRDSISLSFFFASEEYNDFVGSSFNDAFAIIISGPGMRGGKNLAVVPGTEIPINVNNVNFNENRKYYKDNNPFTLAGRVNEKRKSELDPQLLANFQYDGMTRRISAGTRVNPKESYHIKIAIADAGDGTMDSAVMLEAKSLRSQEQYKWVRRRMEIAAKRREDSLIRVQVIQDSLAAIEQARLDSIAEVQAIEQARMDSIAAAQKIIEDRLAREKEIADSLDAQMNTDSPNEETEVIPGDDGKPIPDAPDSPDPEEDMGGFDVMMEDERKPVIRPIEQAKPQSNFHEAPGPQHGREYKAVILFDNDSYFVPDSSEALLVKIGTFLSENPNMTAGIFVPPGGDKTTADLRYDMVRLELLKGGGDQSRIFKNGFSFGNDRVRMSRNRAEIWIRTVD